MNILIYLIDKKNNNLETDLFINYVSRFNKLSDLLKIPNIKVIYLDNKKCKSAKDETIMLKRRIISNSYKIFLDNLGQKLNSVEFSKKIFQKQEDGLENISFLIGGAYGIPKDYKKEGDLILSLGDMVWPHELIKIFLAEQIYRAANIRLGKPYHK